MTRKTLILAITVAFLAGSLVTFSLVYLITNSQSFQEVYADYIILLAGDTHFGENYQERNEEKGEQNILKEKGYNYSFLGIESILQESDFVIVNLETAVTNMKNSPLENTGKSYIHWSDIEKTPTYLKKYNIGAVSLANNHALDYGQQGLIQTIEVLKQNKIDWFGAGLNESSAAKEYIKEFELENEKFTMAIIGAFEYRKSYDKDYSFYAHNETGGVNKLSVEEITKQIKQIKKESKDNVFVIIFPHWGKNYAWKSEDQTNIGHQLIDADADLIIGHGAHRLQEVEKYNGKWIIYNLGNFVFNSPGRYQESGGQPYSLVTQLVLQKTSDGLQKSLKIYPIFSDNKITNYQPRFLEEGEFDSAYRVIVESSPNHEILEKYLNKGIDEIGYFIELSID